MKKLLISFKYIILSLLFVGVLFANMHSAYASEGNPPVITVQPQNAMVQYGQDVQFTINATGTNIKYNWQYKSSINNGTWTNYGNTTNTIRVKANDNDKYLYRCLVSDDFYKDDKAIQSDAASLNIMKSQIYKVKYITEVPTAPVITLQPQPAETSMGKTVTFTVAATGNNLSYQWQYKPSINNGTWTNLSGNGANTTTYKAVGVKDSDSGNEYRCIVRCNDGYYIGDQNAVVSDTATLTVIKDGYSKVVYIDESYQITENPQSVLVFPGESATFRVSAESNTSLTYRWLYKTTDEGSTWSEVPTSMASGTQSDTLVINNVLEDYDNYMFRCSVGGEMYVYEKSLLSNIAYIMTIKPEQKLRLALNPEVAFITEWKIPANADGAGLGTTINLPIPKNSSNSFSVDWGDDTEVKMYTDADYIDADNNPTTFLKHKYENSAETTYTIKIYGNVNKFGYNVNTVPTYSNMYSDYYTFTEYLTKINQWGALGATQYGFANCTNLTGNIPAPIEESFANVTSFENTFFNCGGLTGIIPGDLFENCSEVKNFYSTFSGCGNLVGNIPANLFSNCTQATRFDFVFSTCNKLTGNIPSGLFDNCKEAVNFSYAFNGCSGLDGTIPTDLFAKCNKAERFAGCFNDCISLTGSVSENLFASSTVLNCPADVNSTTSAFYRTFRRCQNLTSANINTKFIGAEMFYGCNNLTDITIGDNVEAIGANAFFATNPYNENNLLLTSVESDNTIAVNYDWANDYRKALFVGESYLAIPTIDGEYVYNGKTQTLKLNDFDLRKMTISNTKRKNAGTEEITISLRDKTKYAWVDGTNEDKVVLWTIEKATGVAPTLTDINVMYDGKTYELAGECVRGTVNYRTSVDGSTWGGWSETKPSLKDVGKLYVQAYTIEDENCEASEISEGTITIGKKTLIVTATSGLSKIYGDSDPTLTYTASRMVAGETPAFTGALAREDGEAFGNYAITSGTLAMADNGAFKASNYEMVFIDGEKLSILPKSIYSSGIVITIGTATYTYNGDASNPVVTGTVPLKYTYTGEEIEPEITVKDNGRTLTKGTDYFVKYENNINVGEGKITITGVGSYEGAVSP